MNVHTALRMSAASYDPAKWVQLRLSMMDSALPWRDPDGVFVSLTESLTGGWEITNNYNGAGGINDGWSEIVVWKTASLGAVFPSRTGEFITQNNLIEYAAVLVSGIPADAAAWLPIMATGCVLNADPTRAMGAALVMASTGSASGQGMAPTGLGGGTINVNTRAAMGMTAMRPPGAMCVVGGFTTAGLISSPVSAGPSVISTVVTTSSGLTVGQGNAVNNPAAGNRVCATKFFARMFDLLSWAPWVDATGWSELGCTSPFDATTPATDPNTLFSSADTSNAPEWRVTIADTGKTGPFDGYTEGIRWNAALPSDLDYSIPTCWAVEITQFNAYMGTQRYGVSVGITDGLSVGVTSGAQGMNNVPAIGPNTVAATANTISGGFANWPGVSDASAGITWPQWATNGSVAAGCVGSALQLAGTFTTVQPARAATTSASLLTAPQVSMSITKDTNTLGTSNPEIRWRAWYAAPIGYQKVWPS